MCRCGPKFSISLSEAYVFIATCYILYIYSLPSVNIFMKCLNTFLSLKSLYFLQFFVCFGHCLLCLRCSSVLVILSICSYLRRVPQKAGKKFWSHGRAYHLWTISLRNTHCWYVKSFLLVREKPSDLLSWWYRTGYIFLDAVLKKRSGGE